MPTPNNQPVNQERTLNPEPNLEPGTPEPRNPGTDL